MANLPLLLNATATLLALLLGCPGSTLLPPEATRPTHSTTQAARLQLEGFKLQTSHKCISGQDFFFFPPRPPPGWEAEKTIPLCYGCLGLLKTLGGLRRTQEIGRCRFRSEPSGWGSSPSDGAGGAVHGGCSESPSEDCTPSPDIPDRSASTDAAPAPGTAPHNEARTCEECL